MCFVQGFKIVQRQAGRLNNDILEQVFVQLQLIAAGALIGSDALAHTVKLGAVGSTVDILCGGIDFVCILFHVSVLLICFMRSKSISARCEDACRRLLTAADVQICNQHVECNVCCVKCVIRNLGEHSPVSAGSSAAGFVCSPDGKHLAVFGKLQHHRILRRRNLHGNGAGSQLCIVLGKDHCPVNAGFCADGILIIRKRNRGRTKSCDIGVVDRCSRLRRIKNNRCSVCHSFYLLA
nr:MAG TPA: hypothetical protein [Caudoviricetes sp.]